MGSCAVLQSKSLVLLVGGAAWKERAKTRRADDEGGERLARSRCPQLQG